VARFRISDYPGAISRIECQVAHFNGLVVIQTSGVAIRKH
jgi:hypothetical protein